MTSLLKRTRSSAAVTALVPLGAVSPFFALALLAALAPAKASIVSPATLAVAGVVAYVACLLALGWLGQRSDRTHGEPRDWLSSLPGREALQSDVETLSKGNEEVALALLDLDGFKEINDRYGHAFGDRLIRRCAEIAREVCDGEARSYRLGGDEFVALLSGPIAGTVLEGICRSLLQELMVPIHFEDRQISVGASIGLSRSTHADRLTPSELLRRADVAMVMSKRGGKMRCTWFNEAFDKRRKMVREIENKLRAGFAREEFELAYQPLVDADCGKIVAVEALMRWNREDGETTGPNVFIPVAEQTGLINPMGLWALRRAMCDGLRWEGITVSVNVSAAQLRNAEFPVKLGELLEETGFPPERLDLEITETCLVLDPVVAERSLAMLRGFGVQISLDDFGTGYASIGFLRQFRFEKLKLDRSLVVDAGEDEGCRAMMISSVAIARALKMGVTAEGVETLAQADLVRMAGCDQIQGWLYYRAMPASEIDTLIDAQHRAEDMKANPPIAKGQAR